MNSSRLLKSFHNKRSFPSIHCKLFSNIIFDRHLKKKQREWSLNLSDSEYYDYLREEAADRLVDRMKDITRKLPCALELGSHRGHILRKLKEEIDEDGETILGIKSFTQCDLAELRDCESHLIDDYKIDTERVFVDEEAIPFGAKSFDIVVSPFSLHWVNDLQSTLIKIKEVLKEDGVFIGSMLGGNTLHELRYCFYLAEQERRGGVGPHASAFASASDIAGLMQATGFALPTVDVDTLTIGYPNALVLMEHIQKMGEGNANWNRQFHVGKDTFLAVASIYQELFALEDGSIPATFQVCIL